MLNNQMSIVTLSEGFDKKKNSISTLPENSPMTRSNLTLAATPQKTKCTF